MLIDRVVVEVRSGKGGDGCISFLQEKNMPKGGPDGGNGGHGGSVYFVAKKNVNTLLAYRHSKLLQAEDGEKGDKKLRYGRRGSDVIAEVPVGTIIQTEDGQFLADLKEDGQTYEAAKGGRGGRGNAAFKSSRNRIPRVAENGIPAEKKRLVLELKLLADCALIGYPSVGKSTLLNLVSRANAQTADYPFTTLVPNLGVCALPDGNSFVMADMPGLIEGAHEGKGLGIQFLKHIERCRVLIHLVSMDGERDPYEAYQAIRSELSSYGADLEKRPEIVCASKMDEEGAEERKAALEKKLGVKIFGISAYTEEGVLPLLKKAFELVQTTPEFPLYRKEEEGGIRIYDAHKDEAVIPFILSHPKSDLWVISGEKIMNEYARYNLSTDEGISRFIALLDKLGVDEALHEKGAKEGDTVMIGDFAFDFVI